VVIEDFEIYLDLNTGSKAQLDRERIEKSCRAEADRAP